MNAKGQAYPYYQHPPNDMAGLRAQSVPGVFPQGHMSQENAAQACANAGKRMCTREEWQSACRSAQKSRFPYGNTMVEGTCNSIGETRTSWPSISRTPVSGTGTGNNSMTRGSCRTVIISAATGKNPSCMTPDGLFDMDGNVSEWVSDISEKSDGTNGTFAGNPFSGETKDGCFHWTNAHSIAYYVIPPGPAAAPIVSDRIISLRGNYLNIDEIQRVPALLNSIQTHLDEGGKQRFILTGSSARKLKKGGVNTLPGRIVSKTLDPLSYWELRGQFHLEKVLSIGSLPGVYLDEEGLEILDSYTNTYLREEIERRL